MLYETISKRRSVRKYSAEPLSQSTLSAIEKHLHGLKQLVGQNARFEIVSGDAVKGGQAPHYIFAYCDGSDAAYANIGFSLQEMDLYIQSLGLGSLWLGMAKPKEKDAEGDFSIMLAFGNTDVPMRSGAKDFNRLNITEVSNADNEVAEAARLAPSAVNSQPWRFNFQEGQVVIEYFGRGLLKGILKKKFSKIDLGIAAKHTEIALLNSGKRIKSILPQSDQKNFSICISHTN